MIDTTVIVGEHWRKREREREIDLSIYRLFPLKSNINFRYNTLNFTH